MSLRTVKNRLSLTLVLLILTSIAPHLSARQFLKEEGVGGSAFHKNDITYSTAVQTPHVAWATPLPDGPLRGFFIPSVQYGRDMVELMQRIELAPTTVSIDRNWDINCWGVGDYYGHEYRGDRDDFQTVYGYVERDLAGPANFDVMLIPGLNGWSRMTRATRDAILRRVREGAGLVLLHPFVGDVKGHPFKGDEPEADTRIWEISPLVGVADDTLNEDGYPEINQNVVAKGKWEITGRHFITDGVPPKLLPEGTVGGSFYKYFANGDVLVSSGGQPVLAIKNYGRGRVVAFGYVEEGFTPKNVDPFQTKIYWDYWEYQYSLLARALLWASGRDTPVRLSSLNVADSDSALRLTLISDTSRTVEIEVAGKSEFGGRLGMFKARKEIARGENNVEVAADALRPAEGWPGGRQIFDVIIREVRTGATLDWGSATLSVAKRAMMTLVKTDADVYKRGETLSVALRAAGDLSTLRMRMKVSDDMGRLLAVVERPASGDRTMTYVLADFVGKSALVTGELLDAQGAVVDHLRAAPVAVVQDSRRAREYTALVSFGGTKHYLQDAQMRQVRAVAADTGLTMSGEGIDNSLNVPRGTFGVYWYDRGPTTPEAMERAIAEYERTKDINALDYLTKKELYRRTGDRIFLRRTPSLDDPAFMSSLTDIVRATARQKARYHMDYYFVGDEGSLTSYGDPFDFDWGPNALSAFREWLRGEYHTLDALNHEWKTSFKGWDEVVPFTTEEARKANNFAPWADHRTYMEVSFARGYQRLRDAVREGDPDGHIAVSGTQATNAYNGADWARLDRVIDDFLSYSGGNQWDMHRSFAKPDAMIGFWTGYGSRGMAVQNAVWTAAAHNVLHPNVFWMYSFLNPDMTHSQSARDMGAVFKPLRFDGIGKLLMESVRQQDAVAIHYSMASVHAASILGYHQQRDDEDEGGKADELVSFPGNRDGWVRVTKDLGLQFDFVSSEQIEQGGLASRKYKALILPLSLALSDEEAKAIEAFARNGGTVIADAGVGMFDANCAWRTDGSLERLFGVRATSAADRRKLAGAGGELKPTSAGASWGLRAKDLVELTVAEPGLKAAGGESLARADDTDAIIVRRIGSGQIIYLNALFDRYPKLRAGKSGGAGHRGLVNALFERAGVHPAVEIVSADEQRITQAQVARYKFGDSEVLVVVKENVAPEGVAGQDGVTVYNDAGLGKIVRQEITVGLPRKYHVTDIRTGKSLGFTDAVRTSIIVGDALVLGLSPTKDALKLDGPSSAALGEHVAFTLSSVPAGRRLLRFHVFAPDGALLKVYAKNLLVENAPAKVVLPSALNDTGGEYTLRATDIVTGASAEAKIELK